MRRGVTGNSTGAPQRNRPRRVSASSVWPWAYLYNDYLFFGMSLPFAGMLALRLVLTVSGLMLVLRLRRGAGEDHLNDRLLFLWALAGTIAIVLIGLSRPIDFSAKAVISVLIVFASYLVFPFHLLYRLGLATLLWPWRRL